ncbi:hypothetical protein LCGC14_1778600 [marine sediment metagenome]|uniref:Uncharacterized protein n=1 Tax=marine sediment metagenome TaxID=412755 RepID=A0A0F9JAZ9_9ZZZZ
MKKIPQLVAMSLLVAVTFSCSKDRDDEIKPVADSMKLLDQMKEQD